MAWVLAEGANSAGQNWTGVWSVAGALFARQDEFVGFGIAKIEAKMADLLRRSRHGKGE